MMSVLSVDREVPGGPALPEPAGGLAGAQGQDATAPPTVVDTGLADFLGARLQESGLNRALTQLENPERLTEILPGGLQQATMRGSQVLITNRSEGLNRAGGMLGQDTPQNPGPAVSVRTSSSMRRARQPLGQRGQTNPSVPPH